MYRSIKNVMLHRAGKPSKPACLFFNQPDIDRDGPKYLLVYFTASWCPSSKSFTPVLNDFYTRHGTSKAFEVLVLSNDDNEKEYQTNLLPSLHPDFLTPEHFSDVVVQNSLISQDYGVQSSPVVCVFRVGDDTTAPESSSSSSVKNSHPTAVHKHRKINLDNVLEEEETDVENRLYYVTRYGREFIHRDFDTAEHFPWMNGDTIIETETKRRKQWIQLGVAAVILGYVIYYYLFSRE